MVTLILDRTMKTTNLPRHYRWSFGRPPPSKEDTQATPCQPAHELKPQPPACTEEQFWELGKTQFCGIILPNRYQAFFFAILCIGLSMPIFFFDESGNGLVHGFITMGSIAAFAAFCWIVGMLLASTVSDDAKEPCRKEDSRRVERPEY